MDSLDDVLDDAWRRLGRAVHDRRHAFRLPTVATVDPDLGVSARTVVLRAVDRAGPSLRFHTDARSPKVAHLRADPRVAWSFWDRKGKVQVRVWTRASLHTADAVARQAWDRLSEPGRGTYRVVNAPGARTGGPTAGHPDDAGDDPDAGVEVFTVVDCRVLRLDWLHLAHGAHRRAVFEGGGLAGRWVQP